jgi:hypothetical protein
MLGVLCLSSLSDVACKVRVSFRDKEDTLCT